MNVRCENCRSRFNIPDHKWPKDKDAVFTCPKCGEKIHIPAKGDKTLDKDAVKPASGPRPGTPLQNQSRALILSPGGPFLQAAVTAAGQLGYAVETAANPMRAVRKMAYHVYPLVVIEDRFDPDGDVISEHINRLDMSVRREICLVLMGRSLKTGDPMSALHASVNCVIGPDNLSEMSAVLYSAVREHTDFYRVYLASMKAAGKA
ncbi:MAG: zinc-ribbon domain-containing protein [Desulfotignum sp.]|nr:zinc-ribbon domain-containing protein [Desulfotignum sp.]